MKKKKILSIEDNTANRKIIYDFLTLRGGYEVIEATNGNEGLRKIENERPDLVLVDIQLPEMDGLEITKIIRNNADPCINKLPIIIISSFAMNGDKKKGFEAGCNAYFVKPLKLKELLETVNRLLK